MYVGINLLYLIPGVVGGTETYARELIKSMLEKISESDKIVIFCSRESEHTFAGTSRLKIVTLPFYSNNRIARIFAEQVLLPIYCVAYKINVLLSLGYSQPLLVPCKTIVTIHDLNWYYHPEDFTKLALFFWKYLTIFSAYKSNAIIAISQSTKNSLISVLNIKPEKVHVIYHGMSKNVEEKNPSISVVARKYALPKKYIFTLLSHYSHKNLETLIHAFMQVQSKAKDLHLVIGGTGTFEARVERQKYLSTLDNKNIHMLPFVDASALATIYENASIFVFPSAYEGFGLPVLEAMSHDVPVISSNAYSLKEVVGSGGILVNPFDVEEYVSSINKILKDAIVRKKYVLAGRKQVHKFTWDKCATETLNLIQRLYNGSTYE